MRTYYSICATWRHAVVLAACALLAACEQKSAASPRQEVPLQETRDSLVGRRAPAVMLDGIEGERVALADLLGEKPIYLKFWATWCEPCVKQMPHLEEIHRRHGDRMAVYAVNLGFNDPIETVRAFQLEQRLATPIAIDRDGGVAEQFHVAITPLHVLIDRGGVIRHVGHEVTAELDEALEELIRDGVTAGDAPPVAPGAEQLSLTLLDGSTFTMAKQAGRPVALTFVSLSCDSYLAESRPAMSKACIAHARQVESLRPAHDGVVWVTIAHPVWAAESKLDRYRTRVGHRSPIGLDRLGRWFHRFGVRDVPVTILFDRSGAEVERVTGPGEGLPAALSRLR